MTWPATSSPPASSGPPSRDLAQIDYLLRARPNEVVGFVVDGLEAGDALNVAYPLNLQVLLGIEGEQRRAECLDQLRVDALTGWGMTPVISSTRSPPMGIP